MSFTSIRSNCGSPMSKLSAGYNTALDRLQETSGQAITEVVRTIIESKHSLDEFKQYTELLNIDEIARSRLVAMMQDQVTSSAVAMCIALGKGFKHELLPLVNQVTEEALTGKHLQ